MADENLAQKMESMLQGQAGHDARIKQIEEIILQIARGTRDRFQATDKRADEKFEATDKRLDDVDVKIAALVDAQIRTEESVKKTGDALRALANSQIRTEESLKETQESLRETQESIKKTDEALRWLSALVDRYISERRNGSSGTSTNPQE